MAKIHLQLLIVRLKRIISCLGGANQKYKSSVIYPLIVLTNAYKTQKRWTESVHSCRRYAYFFSVAQKEHKNHLENTWTDLDVRGTDGSGLMRRF